MSSRLKNKHLKHYVKMGKTLKWSYLETDILPKANLDLVLLNKFQNRIFIAYLWHILFCKGHRMKRTITYTALQESNRIYEKLLKITVNE